MKFKTFTDSQKKEMAEQYNAGKGLKALSELYGVSVPTMAKYVRAGGGAVRKPGFQSNDLNFVKTVDAINAAMQTVKVDITPVILEEPVVPVRVLLSMD